LSFLSQRQSVPAGFEGLLEHQLDPLYRFARSLTRDPLEAEDLLQETVLHALQAYPRFEAGGNFKAWVFKILYNAFCSRYRRRRRELPLPLEELPETVSPAPDALERLAHAEVRQAVEDLAEDFRLAVVLVDFEGLSYREAAEALGCPLGTVMSRLSRARGLLRLSLSALAPSPGPSPRPRPKGTQP
jgi:RNA polymerase sigma-70 factor (ECF subfamily)